MTGFIASNGNQIVTIAAGILLAAMVILIVALVVGAFMRHVENRPNTGIGTNPHIGSEIERLRALRKARKGKGADG